MAKRVRRKSGNAVADGRWDAASLPTEVVDIEELAEELEETMKPASRRVVERRSESTAEKCVGVAERIESLLEDNHWQFRTLGELPRLTYGDVRATRETLNSETSTGDPLYYPSNEVLAGVQIADIVDHLLSLSDETRDEDIAEECLGALSRVLALLASAVRNGSSPVGRAKSKMKLGPQPAAKPAKPKLTVKERIARAAANAPGRMMRLKRLWDF